MPDTRRRSEAEVNGADVRFFERGAARQETALERVQEGASASRGAFHGAIRFERMVLVDTEEPMSTESVEIVREALGLIGARKGEPHPRLLELLSPEVNLDFSRRHINPDVYEGHAGVLRALKETDEIWEHFHVTPDQLVDAGDVVFVTESMRARGKGSGVETTFRIISVWTVRDGRIAQVTWYYDRQEALKAAGLAN